MATGSESTELTVAAVQMEAPAGAADANIEQAERLARNALEAGADVVGLPEFFTSRVFVDDAVEDAVLPPDNDAESMLVSLATEYDAVVGGSMLRTRGDDVYNTYCLAGPDGTIQTHDKDIPTMWENAYYVGGDDDGVVETPHGTAGLAVCWELIRQQTLDRLANHAQYAITGNHWWSLPDNWPGVDRLFGSTRQYNRYLSENAPVEFARALQIPVIHASHCGEFEGRYLLYPGDERGLPYRTSFVGATQIVAADGEVLARRELDEGPGVVTATIEIPSEPPANPPGLEYSGDRFWVPNLTAFHRLYWAQQNACGTAYYERNKERYLPETVPVVEN
ncbi:carbon-nitrogen hydrolase family protein [Haloglomus halophilum]|uniref:carbon-nitrogen hydrolase family protein n=1 Tax=Haloglomus halophilum TaxID=2962672 RepID=UPI0020C9FD71|nr:carbon-nitrogen hydrolase family protein [Haloglomus halophilum]